MNYIPVNTTDQMTAVHTPATIGRMPNQPKTKGRSIRIPDDLWAEALEKSKAEDTTVTAVIISALEKYVKK